MAGRKLRVVLVAEESAGVQALHRLIALQPAIEVTAVLTSLDGLRGGRALVREAALRLGLPLLPAELVRSSEFAGRLREERVDLLLNVHSLFVLHREVVAAPRIGSFNLHPGPLPEYAGLNVPSWAIYNGEQEHAATVHWMEEGIDTGPVAWTASFRMTDTDTGLSVTAMSVRRGVPLVAKLVETAARDVSSIPRREQDASRRRYFDAGPPNAGRLDWSRPAAEVVRFVRAADYAPFPSPWGQPQADLEGRNVGIAKAAATGIRARAAPGTVSEVSEAGALVATADELVLLQRVMVDGRPLAPQDVFAD